MSGESGMHGRYYGLGNVGGRREKDEGTAKRAQGFESFVGIFPRMRTQHTLAS